MIHMHSSMQELAFYKALLYYDGGRPERDSEEEEREMRKMDAQQQAERGMNACRLNADGRVERERGSDRPGRQCYCCTHAMLSHYKGKERQEKNPHSEEEFLVGRKNEEKIMHVFLFFLFSFLSEEKKVYIYRGR